MISNGETDLPLDADVSTQRVAQVYAEALLNVADKQGQTAAVLEELDVLVRQVFPAEPHLKEFLSSGAIGREIKGQVLRKVFEGRASTLFSDFLLVLNEHDRLDLLPAIAAAARQLYEQRTGHVRIQVRSAVPLPDDQRDRLRQELRATFRKEPVLETRVDPGLLGGLVVQVGDWLYDASVSTQLDIIRNQLIERSSHEIQSRRDRFGSAIGN
jgi:F-type H+-transporting ATPase subunit delta